MTIATTLAGLAFALHGPAQEQAADAVRASGLRFPSPEATAATPASIILGLRQQGTADRIDARLVAECGRLGLTLEDLLGLCLGLLRSPPAREP
jgi:hypothetical protein